MAKDCHQYVQSCEICACSKSSRSKPWGLLIPLPVPTRPWENIALDFIVELPPSEGHTTILVVVDRLTKMAHFLPLKSVPTAAETAVFLKEIKTVPSKFPGRDTSPPSPILVDGNEEYEVDKILDNKEHLLKMNKSWVTEFVLAGLTNNTELRIPLFALFLLVYITTMISNMGIVTLTIVDRHLHKPMYFFLSNLSFVDITYSSSVTLKMLKDFLSEIRTISLVGCALQMYFFVCLATIECLLLGIMAYDRYVAICSPLLYRINMSDILCLRMVVAAYFGGLVNSLVHTVLMFQLNFCRPKIIDHFFCDLPPLYKLSCSDPKLALFFYLITISSLILILISYTNIVLAILKIHSTQGRYKAFNTCSSHMTTVSIFYGTVFFIYLRPSSSYAPQQDRVASVFYSILIPMLNPLIYSFRNAEVTDALKSSFKYFKG
ncbi:olfactory receptor 5F1-like [Hyperolius riggenbachi]|uniref:olfactory receptor 5F1-like n=1 Tax=Hyperolius riggenbachi TaxID=752182 RepID=UPI0035A3816D